MAIGVIGGLTASTVLSLVFVPAFYLVMDDAETLAIRILRGLGRTPPRGRAGTRALSRPLPADRPTSPGPAG